MHLYILIEKVSNHNIWQVFLRYCLTKIRDQQEINLDGQKDRDIIIFYQKIIAINITTTLQQQENSIGVTTTHHNTTQHHNTKHTELN